LVSIPYKCIFSFHFNILSKNIENNVTYQFDVDEKDKPMWTGTAVKESKKFFPDFQTSVKLGVGSGSASSQWAEVPVPTLLLVKLTGKWLTSRLTGLPKVPGNRGFSPLGPGSLLSGGTSPWGKF
jgi:hypothetical protein